MKISEFIPLGYVYEWIGFDEMLLANLLTMFDKSIVIHDGEQCVCLSDLIEIGRKIELDALLAISVYETDKRSELEK